MMSTGKKKTLWAFVGIVAAVLAVATIVAGLVAPGFAYSTFDTLLIVLLAVGAALGILSFVLPLDFLPLLTTAVFGCAFGRAIYRAAPVIADKANNISFQGGSFAMVVVYLTLIGVACLILIVSCFQRETK